MITRKATITSCLVSIGHAAWASLTNHAIGIVFTTVPVLAPARVWRSKVNKLGGSKFGRTHRESVSVSVRK